MYEKHAELYGALTPQEASTVWACLHQNGLLELPPPAEVCGQELALRCSDMSHVEVVLSMSRNTDPVAMDALEKLIARPIYFAARGESGVASADIEGRPLKVPVGYRRGEPPSVAMPEPVRRRAQGQTMKRDPRVIYAVQENPKRPGSAAYERYKLYRVGLSMDAAMAMGVTRADIRWDVQQGFIKCCMPRDYEELAKSVAVEVANG